MRVSFVLLGLTCADWTDERASRFNPENTDLNLIKWNLFLGYKMSTTLLVRKMILLPYVWRKVLTHLSKKRGQYDSLENYHLFVTFSPPEKCSFVGSESSFHGNSRIRIGTECIAKNIHISKFTQTVGQNFLSEI